MSSKHYLGGLTSKKLLPPGVFHPCEALRPYIACFIVSEQDAPLSYTVLPDTALVMGFQYRGRLSLLADAGDIQLATAGITGLQQAYRRFGNSAPVCTLLVKFKPGGAAAFFRLPLQELFSQSLSLDLLAARSAISRVEEQLSEAVSTPARIRVIEAFLLSCKIERPADQLVEEAVRQITRSAGNVRIAALARQLHTSASPLEKRFRSRIGASPKQYATIVRFQSILSAGSHSRGAAGRAYDAGYFDQAHFIRDFSRFSGQTPEAFFTGKAG